MTYTEEEREQINRSYERAVRNLNPQGWRIMLPNEKKELLQSIENKNAMDQQRIPCEVTTEPMSENQLGYYQDNEIHINSDLLNSENYMESVNCLFHESQHSMDTQAQYFPEVRRQYTEEELSSHLTPVPDPELDYQGYYNHPAEISARNAGKEGVEKVSNDQAHIRAVDAEMAQEHPMNQILQTYNYTALDQPVHNEESHAEQIDNSQHI